MELMQPEQALRLPNPAPRKRAGRRLLDWLAYRYQVSGRRDTFVWRVASGSVFLFGSLAMAAAVPGMPTGFGLIPDVLVFVLLNILGMAVAAYAVSLLLSLIYLPLPRRCTAVTLYVAGEAYLILYLSEFGLWPSAILAAAFALAGVGAGCLLGLLLRLRASARSKLLISLGLAVLAAVLLLNGLSPAALPAGAAGRSEDSGEIAAVAPLDAANPEEPGGYAVQSFTYGSGEDRHRELFAAEVDVRTAAVDASRYIAKWPWLKKLFWGFDQSDLPVNGRVWMPEGAGPFPLVLMVHGNHLMEDFSDGGYGYLGELLASKGIIAVSVDENFLNYSVWSGIPEQDMKMRAWMLLKHMEQIAQLNDNPDNPFSGRVDLGRVGLIGHSRGGQAVAMAADAGRWFSDDEAIKVLEQATIVSVMAIAPTDKRVDEKSAYLSNVNYLTLQGAMDADVNNFYGERQYNRSSFIGQEGRFKAALYIADANHSQFNEDWGIMDERLPADCPQSQRLAGWRGAAFYIPHLCRGFFPDNAACRHGVQGIVPGLQRRTGLAAGYGLYKPLRAGWL